jgi:hypothetical protein
MQGLRVARQAFYHLSHATLHVLIKEETLGTERHSEKVVM